MKGDLESMFDIHAHVLPNILHDDGPKHLEKSLEMIERARKDGVSAIVATPHMMIPVENRKEEIKKAIQSLGELPIPIYIGSEIFADDIVLANDNSLIPLGDSNYLLIEFPRAELPQHVDEIFFVLQTKGFECIFAHPERNGSIINDPNLLVELIRKSVLCQVNAGSILGSYGKTCQKTAQILLEHNMVHFIASDMHSPNRLYYSLKEAVAQAQEYTDSASDMVLKNPQTILNNGFLEVSEPKQYKKRGFWFFGRR